MGMVANRDIKQVTDRASIRMIVRIIVYVQGETIVKEDPVLVVNMSLPESDRKSILLEKFTKLGEKDRRKIESLYDSEPEGAEEFKIMRIFSSNSIQGRLRVEKISHFNFIFYFLEINGSSQVDVTD